MPNEEEFNFICNFLNIDNADVFDEVLYVYYHNIAKNSNKDLHKTFSQKVDLQCRLPSNR